VSRSRSPARAATYVDASKTESHLDPLTAAPAKNQYLKTVVPWLKRVIERRYGAAAATRVTA
jgi:hypothetical protein